MMKGDIHHNETRGSSSELNEQSLEPPLGPIFAVNQLTVKK